MSMLNKDIDYLIIKLLNIDDLANLYQVNKYYCKLTKPLLNDFIAFYSKNAAFPLHLRNCGTLKNAMWFGDLEISKHLFNRIKPNFDDIERAFRWSCSYGNIDIAKWLYSLDNVDIHADYDFTFIWSCRNNHLDVAKWLYSLDNFCTWVIDDAFNESCDNGHLDVTEWLCSLQSRYRIYGIINHRIQYDIRY